MRMVTVEISRQDVWTEVMKETEYIGAKNIGEQGEAVAGMYDRLRMTGSDAETLGRSWDEAVSRLTGLVGEWTESVATPGNDCRIVLRMTDNWRHELKESMEHDMRGYLVMLMAAEWYKRMDAEVAGVYEGRGEVLRGEILDKLYSRRRPERKRQAEASRS